MTANRFFLSLIAVLLIGVAGQAQASSWIDNTAASVSYLYWKPYQDQTVFAVNNGIITDPTITSGESIQQKYKWSSGVRVEVATLLPCSPLDLVLGWTGYWNSSSNSISNTTGFIVAAGVSGPMGSGSPFILASGAHSHMRLRYNVANFDAGYRTYVCQGMLVRPFIGLFVADILQKQQVDYDNAFQLNNGPPPFFSASVERKTHFTGVGPEIGVSGKCPIWDSLSLLGHASIGLAAGEFKTRVDTDLPIRFNNVAFAPILKKSFWRVRPTTDIRVAFDWNFYHTECASVSLAVGYEFQYWWQQWFNPSNGMGRLVDGSSAFGDLELQGLTVSLNARF